MSRKARNAFFLSLLLSIASPAYCLSEDAERVNYSPSLSQFVTQIVETNATVQSEEASVDAARFQAKGESQPLYNPSVSLQGAQTDTPSFNVSLSQTLDLSSKRAARTNVGNASLVVAQTQLVMLRLDMSSQALTALSQYTTEQKLVNLAKKKTHLLNEFVRQIAKKSQAGDLSRVELDQANRVLAEAISEQAEAEEALSVSKQTLDTLASNQLITVPPLPGKLPSLSKIDNFEPLLTHLPPLQLLNEEVEQAKANMNVAKTQTHADPTVSIFAGKDEEGQPLVGANVSIPLFVRNNYQAGIGQANNEAIAVEKSRLNLYQASRANLQGSFNRYQIASHAYQLWQTTSENSLRDGKTLLNKLWEAGELSTTDYLIQVKQMIDSQAAGVRLQGEAWNAWFAWLQASNTLNQWLSPSNHFSKGTQK